MNKWTRRLLLLALIVLVVMGVVLIEQNLKKSVPMGEVISPDEDAVMAAAVASSLRMINNTRDGLISESEDDGQSSMIYRRDVHIKTHGCVMANFTVLDVESKYRRGVFKVPRTYPAWIRYSNGDYTMKSDKQWDARGMAIKLMGVPGEKLLAAQKNAPTQDFLMMNSTNYFIRNLEDYVELTKYLAKKDDFGYFLNGYSLNPFSWRLRELRLVAGTKKRAPNDILQEQFYSASAYKLGPAQNIKFSAKPTACESPTTKMKSYRWKTPRSNDNFLRERMQERLTIEAACFDFMVQLQVPGKNMPVEDATIRWSEKDSPFVTVARIEIPAQTFDTPEQNAFCENLSYNPWHALPDHRPIGVFNRVRKALYEEVARYRWDMNRRLGPDTPDPGPLTIGEPPEPTSWCIDPSRTDCGPTVSSRSSVN